LRPYPLIHLRVFLLEPFLALLDCASVFAVLFGQDVLRDRVILPQRDRGVWEEAASACSVLFMVMGQEVIPLAVKCILQAAKQMVSSLLVNAAWRMKGRQHTTTVNDVS
jgi:hypothetical protein